MGGFGTARNPPHLNISHFQPPASAPAASLVWVASLHPPFPQLSSSSTCSPQVPSQPAQLPALSRWAGSLNNLWWVPVTTSFTLLPHPLASAPWIPQVLLPLLLCVSQVTFNTSFRVQSSPLLPPFPLHSCMCLLKGPPPLSPHSTPP